VIDASLNSRPDTGKDPNDDFVTNDHHSHWHMGALSPYSFKKYILSLLMFTLCVAPPVAVVQPKSIFVKLS
jgi:hypothetical protein